MEALNTTPAVTVMPIAGEWRPADCALARQHIDAKETDAVTRGGAGWRRAERNELITGALNTIAGFACGRAISKIIDPDGSLSSSRTDQDDTQDDFTVWSVILTAVYTVICLAALGCGIYYLFGKVDAAEKARHRVAQKIEAKKTTKPGQLKPTSPGSQQDLLANELGSRVAHKFQTSVLTGVINKWSSTQMFTVAVLLHDAYDWQPSGDHAQENAWKALQWLIFISLVLVIAFYELPARLCARYQLVIDLARLDRVVDVGAGALAWLLAVFCMEALEITAAHLTMEPENLKNVHYYSSAYHGFPVTLRTAVCLCTFVATGLVLFTVQQIAKRVDAQRRLCCRRCHPDADEEYIRNATESGPGMMRRDFAYKLHFIGQHGHRILESIQKVFTNISSIALQRLIMGLITFRNWTTPDDFVLKGKSASDAASGVADDVVQTVEDIVGPDPVPEPQPEPDYDGSASGSGSWFEDEVNITETISPLLSACRAALASNNATLLYDSIRSTRDGLSVDGKVVKEVDPEPEPLPEPEPEPEPLPEPDEATMEKMAVTALRSATWTDCHGDSQELACSVVPALAHPRGNQSWVDAQCLDDGGAVDVPAVSWFHTGAMQKDYCRELPLYGDAILLTLFAVLCSLVALWILLVDERSLRRRLQVALEHTEQHAARNERSEQNPVMMGGAGGADGAGGASVGETQLWLLQTRYDYRAMLTQQKRSFCQWIVNKTWWDVTYNTMKYLDWLGHYYLMAFVFTGIAAVTPLILYDSSLIRATLCGGNGGRSVEGIKRGLLHRSISSERSSGADEDGRQQRGYNSLGRQQDDAASSSSSDERDSLVPRGSSDGEWPAGGGGGGGEQLVSIEGILSGPAAGEDEVQQLRQQNRQLQARVAELQALVAGVGGGGGDAGLEEEGGPPRAGVRDLL